MSITAFRDLLLENPRFHPFLADIKVIPACQVRYAPIKNQPAVIQDYLDKKGIELYSHQDAVIHSILEGEDLILCTPTASGKTLAFFLPFLKIRADNPSSTALALYPAKALTRDQLRAAEDLERTSGINLKPAIYDGDTPRSLRPGIRKEAGLVLSNPYELHQILAWHRQWADFFRSLKYIIIDEAHQLRGVFGSHVALLIRRMRRICAYYGSDPVFLLSSATLANPGQFARDLTGKECLVIDESGAPCGERSMILYNPYQTGLTDRSSFSEASLLMASLVESGLQTLCFTGSRRMTELIASWARDRIHDGPEGKPSIVAYRAGYLPEERKKIEQDFKEGNIRGIVSTNALELGIDIGSLDAVVMTGYPGTMMSVWQQTGRAGRMATPSLAVLVGFHSPLDQFFMRNPEAFFEKPHENAFINLKNPYILSGEILCASAELPLKVETDVRWFGDSLYDIIESMQSEHLLTNTPRGVIYSGRKRATELVSISDMGESWTLESGGNLLETLSLNQACHEAHPGAVFIHLGDIYLVRRWDQQMHRILADREDVGYYTRADHQVMITVQEAISSRPMQAGTLVFGMVEVTERTFGFRKIRDGITIGQEPLDIPPISYKTSSVWIILNNTIEEEVLKEGGDLSGGLHGAEHSLIAMMPCHLLCDRWDIGGLSTAVSDQVEGRPAIFIYDGYEGGIGLSEMAYSIYEEIAETAYQSVSLCLCDEGCPACIHSPKCGNDNQPLDKKSTIRLLKTLKEKKEV